jgi:hypothetical protein
LSRCHSTSGIRCGGIWTVRRPALLLGGPTYAPDHRLGDGDCAVQNIDARACQSDQLTPTRTRPSSEEDQQAIAVLDRIRDGLHLRDRRWHRFGRPLRSRSGQHARVARNELVLHRRRQDRLEQSIGLRNGGDAATGGEPFSPAGPHRNRSDLGDRSRAERRPQMVREEAGVQLAGSRPDLTQAHPGCGVLAEGQLSHGRIGVSADALRGSSTGGASMKRSRTGT